MITAIVPARNEEVTVGNVLETLKASPLIDEVILVDDGSKDRTGEVGRQLGVKVVRREQEMGKGKGEAMEAGVQAASGDIILFADADIIGFEDKYIRALVEPVRNGEALMTIGERDRSKLAMWWALYVGPWIGGERAMPRDFWQSIPPEFKHLFLIETALNFYARKRGGRILAVPLWGVTQRRKEQKLGIIIGFWQRIRMFWQVGYAHFLLYTGLTPLYLAKRKVHSEKR